MPVSDSMATVRQRASRGFFRAMPLNEVKASFPFAPLTRMRIPKASTVASE